MPTVLVIDDDDDVRNTVRELLELKGVDVAVASNGRVGLKVLREANVDAVITDIYMPEMEGIETIRTFRAMRPAIPIIAMSGGGASEQLDSLRWAQQLGAFRALAKPMDLAALMDAVQAALAKASAVATAASRASTDRADVAVR